VAQPLHPALKAVSDAVLAVASQLSVDEVLQRLVNQARELAGARYAALGIPDGSGGFRRFLVAGMSDELIDAMGPLPRTHGVLGLMLESPQPYRTDDIHEHPRFHGWWPARHPDMHSFLGVPIVAAGEVIGSFYLTDKLEAPVFNETDQALIELLASHAAIAITNARLFERSRELSILSERNRVSLELHDAVSQKLFGVVLTAEAAATLIDQDDRHGARAKVARTGELAREALDELRALIHGLRPPELARDGLDGALRKELAVLNALHDARIELRVDAPGPPDPARDAEVLRIAQEAIGNALRHASARHITVELGNAPLLRVSDDGTGFDAGTVRGRHLGLTSMEERARAIGAQLEIVSRPGAGTTVTLV
jgi:signal transduction histidine kinase